MNVVGYVRMSTGYQENSPENQKSSIMDYCVRHGHSLVKFYEDLAISGGKMDKRSSLLEMIVDAENNGFGILFYKYDRAFRNLGEQIAVLGRLKNKGIFFDGVTDPTGEGAGGELVINILGAVNQFERQLTGERIYHNNREKARKGFWTGGNGAPFGYDYNKVTKELTINPEEAPIVKAAFDIYLHHRSANATAHLIRPLGSTKKGNAWTIDKVIQMLCNPVYIGMIRYGHRRPVPGKNWYKRVDDYEVFPGRHEAIIDEATFAEAQEILKNNAVTRRKPAMPYVLSGILKCSKCGGRVSAMRDRYGQAHYRCAEHITKRSCEGWSRLEKKILPPILDAINQNVTAVDPADFNVTPEVEQAPQFDTVRQLKQVEKKIMKLYFAFENDQVDAAFFVQRNKELLKEKERLMRSNGGGESNVLTKDIITSISDFQSLWSSADFAGKKLLLTGLIDKLYTDGENIEIYFRDFGLPGWQTVVNTTLLLL